MSLDGNGEQGGDGTFSSKKVDWTQESGSPRRRRKKRDRREQEGKLQHITRHSGLSNRHPSPKVSLDPSQGQTAQPHLLSRKVSLPQFFAGGGLSIKEHPWSCPSSLPNQATIPQRPSPYLCRAAPLPRQAGRQAGRAGRRLQDLPTSSPHQWPQRYLLTITTTMMAQIAPSMIIILQFFHQYFLFSLAALLSNCDAPACKASARSSSSDNFWSLSKTLSTFTRMMSTTSSTCAWVCCNRLLLVVLGGGPGGPPPGAAPSVPSAGG